MVAQNRLLELREKANISREELANKLGENIESIYDLEEHDGDMILLTLDELKTICETIDSLPSSLLKEWESSPGKIFTSSSQIMDAISNYLNTSQMSLEEFEDRVGWGGIGTSLQSPNDIWNWSIDCFINICRELSANWLASLENLLRN